MKNLDNELTQKVLQTESQPFCPHGNVSHSYIHMINVLKLLGFGCPARAPLCPTVHAVPRHVCRQTYCSAALPGRRYTILSRHRQALRHAWDWYKLGRVFLHLLHASKFCSKSLFRHGCRLETFQILQYNPNTSLYFQGTYT